MPPARMLAGPLKEVQELLTDAFTGAAERHIEVGDGLDMLIIHKDEGVRWVHMREFWILWRAVQCPKAGC